MERERLLNKGTREFWYLGYFLFNNKIGFLHTSRLSIIINPHVLCTIFTRGGKIVNGNTTGKWKISGKVYCNSFIFIYLSAPEKTTTHESINLCLKVLVQCAWVMCCKLNISIVRTECNACTQCTWDVIYAKQ